MGENLPAPRASQPLTRDSRNPFDCKEKNEVEKFNGKDNKLWRAKTTNFLAAKLLAVHEMLVWAEKQTEPVVNSILKPLALMMKELVNDPAVVSYHLWVG
jgi:hypothetical protein